MSDKAGEAVPLHDPRSLVFPESGRILIENMKEGIVLGGRHRQLQDPSEEEGHHRATAAPLCLQMADRGNRHVVRKIQGPEAIEVAVEHPGTKTLGFPVFAVSVDSPGAKQKLFLVVEQVSVVIQIVDIDFKPARTNFLKKRPRHPIAAFGNNLE